MSLVYDFVALGGTGPALFSVFLDLYTDLLRRQMFNPGEVIFDIVAVLAMSFMSQLAGIGMNYAMEIYQAKQAIETGRQMAAFIKAIAFIHNLTLAAIINMMD